MKQVELKWLTIPQYSLVKNPNTKVVAYPSQNKKGPIILGVYFYPEKDH